MVVALVLLGLGLGLRLITCGIGSPTEIQSVGMFLIPSVAVAAGAGCVVQSVNRSLTDRQVQCAAPTEQGTRPGSTESLRR